MTIHERKYFPQIFLFLFALLLYANTLTHEFVLDDGVVIARNDFVKQGFAGIKDIFSHDSFAGFEQIKESTSLLEGGRYRPLSLASFAVLYSLAGPNTVVFHLFSIVVFGVAALMLFLALSSFLREHHQGKWIAFFTVLLFIAHPVHTEVVANVKSVDESLALLFGMSALLTLSRFADTSKSTWLITSTLLFFLACLSKESAITLAPVGPLALWFFRKPGWKKLLISCIPFLLGALAFLWMRQQAIGLQPEGTVMADPLNNPFLQWNNETWIPSSTSAKAATIIYTLGEYLRLMVYPAPLIHGYYPQHFVLQSFSSTWVVISMVIYLVMILYGIWSIRTRSIPGFGILFFLITLSLTSNVFILHGSFMAERFIFLPSAGLLLALVYFLLTVIPENKAKWLTAFFCIVALALSVVAIQRNFEWKSNETLFRADTNKSPNNAKFRNELGTLLLEKGVMELDTAKQRAYFQAAYPHLRRALELIPDYYDALLAFGACAYYVRQFDYSVYSYQIAGTLNPNDAKANTGLWYALQGYGRDKLQKADTTRAFEALNQAWQMAKDTSIAFTLSRYYAEKNNTNLMLEWQEKATWLLPENAAMMMQMAIAYRKAGYQAKAKEWYQRAKETDPNIPDW